METDSPCVHAAASPVTDFVQQQLRMLLVLAPPPPLNPNSVLT